MKKYYYNECSKTWGYNSEKAKISYFNSQAALEEIASKWGTRYNMMQFLVLSKHWTPKPNVAVMVWISASGAKYHTQICRYVNANFTQIELIEACFMGKTPCSVCNPPVLPKTNDPNSNKNLSITSLSEASGNKYF